MLSEKHLKLSSIDNFKIEVSILFDRATETKRPLDLAFVSQLRSYPVPSHDFLVHTTRAQKQRSTRGGLEVPETGVREHCCHWPCEDETLDEQNQKRHRSI